jgi:hypothetical protein
LISNTSTRRGYFFTILREKATDPDRPVGGSRNIGLTIRSRGARRAAENERNTWLFGPKRRNGRRRGLFGAHLRTRGSKGTFMQILSARHVKPEESARLGVVSGWYSTKVSGTFVTGPHTTQEDCLSKILELNPPPAKKKFIAS